LQCSSLEEEMIERMNEPSIDKRTKNEAAFGCIDCMPKGLKNEPALKPMSDTKMPMHRRDKEDRDSNNDCTEYEVDFACKKGLACRLRPIP